MNSVLIIIEATNEDRSSRSTWPQLRQDVRAVAGKYPEIELLSESCLLARLDSGMSPLAALLFELEGAQFPYRVLFFEQPPAWVKARVSET